ncbi:sugar transferase [Bizionia paragorgiae]|uniref:sugar transferase n=1 Tax=Bizionia paragorgiae TaxID=283786 RepID=UPI00299D8D96|nr:sugar transferase [Bizionia paragorgiae]MDX1271105.1 sugar transferase [Bizionia paragorgiae]
MLNRVYSYKIVKRTADIICAALMLLLFFWVILSLIFISSFDTKSFGLFKQIRIGRHLKPFTIYKIKTIKKDGEISKIGAFLRRSKLDELPQVFNVLIGNMSFVGPRPDVPGFADNLKVEHQSILSVRPGITGPASLYFRNEEAILAKVENPKQYNADVIWPKKVALNMKYVQELSFKKDIYYLVNTIVKL